MKFNVMRASDWKETEIEVSEQVVSVLESLMANVNEALGPVAEDEESWCDDRLVIDLGNNAIRVYDYYME